jgi:tRNA pseudouridine55 synthase
LSAAEKSYDAVVRLGIATDTGDGSGMSVGSRFTGPFPGREAIEHALDAFRGTFLQQPPVYSAKKIGGRRSHRLARTASRAALLASDHGSPLPVPVTVTVRALELNNVDGDSVMLRVDCSAGFYLRGLARDLGERLGIGAHLAALRRLRSGDLTLAEATPLAALEREPQMVQAALVPLARMLPALTPVTLTDEGARRARHGLDLGPTDFEGALGDGSSAPGGKSFRLLDKRGALIGVAEPIEWSGLLHPAVVLV